MKKRWFVLIAALLVLFVGAPSAYAAPQEKKLRDDDPRPSIIFENRGFVDLDGDGICDNCPGGGICLPVGRGRKAGAGHAGSGKGFAGHAGSGKGFVDANDDGICDNFPCGGRRGVRSK